MTARADPAGAGSLARRYVTLATAQALECNRCGDCCDSRRTDGYWTWGDLPPDQYGLSCGGAPLIIPIERSADGWRDRTYHPSDAAALSPSRFRCTAFQPQPDGTGLCGRHLQTRPDRCAEFPVRGSRLLHELATSGSAALQTDAFPRCTWYRMVVVPEGDPRLSA